MCTPMMAAGAGIAGGVLGGIGAAGQHTANADSLEAQAAGLKRDIAAEKLRSAYEIARAREETSRVQGRARAGFAANGLALSGSAAEVLRDTAIEADLDVEAIRWSSAEKVKSLNFQRKTAQYNAKQARTAAPLAFLSSALGGVAKFGGSFG